MAVKLFLNSQTIMNHIFPVVGKNAYDATEVDKFLDSIIQDYKKVEDNSLILKKEYEDLTSKNRSLEQEKRIFFDKMKDDPALARAITIGKKEIAARLELIKSDKKAVHTELDAII